MTSAQLRAWLFLVCHSPLVGFWLLQVVVAVVGIVRGFSHPGELLVAAGTIGTLSQLTRLIAKQKGLRAWPPSLSALRATGPTLPRVNSSADSAE